MISHPDTDLILEDRRLETVPTKILSILPP